MKPTKAYAIIQKDKHGEVIMTFLSKKKRDEMFDRLVVAEGCDKVFDEYGEAIRRLGKS